jgi:heptose II phosphotransferase
MIVARIADWKLMAAPAHAESMAALAREALAPGGAPALPQRCHTILRDDAHSYVGLLTLEGRTLVAKSPRAKDRRPWIRLTTLLRRGFAARVMLFLEAAQRCGLPVAEPWGALERRRAGMLHESWLLYGHVPGRPCTAADLPRVIATLRRLHACGWVHGDAHIANFLMEGGEAWIIDAEPRRRPWGRVSEAYDFIRLRNSLGGAAQDLLPPRAGAAWRIAQAYDEAVHAWRAVKRRLRGVRPEKAEAGR